MLWKIENLLCKIPTGKNRWCLEDLNYEVIHVSCYLLIMCWDLSTFQKLELISPSAGQPSEAMWKYIISHLSLSHNTWIKNCTSVWHLKSLDYTSVGVKTTSLFLCREQKCEPPHPDHSPVSWVSSRSAWRRISTTFHMLFACLSCLSVWYLVECFVWRYILCCLFVFSHSLFVDYSCCYWLIYLENIWGLLQK